MCSVAVSVIYLANKDNLEKEKERERKQRRERMRVRKRNNDKVSWGGTEGDERGRG